MDYCPQCGAMINTTAGTCPNGCDMVAYNGPTAKHHKGESYVPGTPAVDLAPLVEELKVMNINLRDIWTALDALARVTGR